MGRLTSSSHLRLPVAGQGPSHRQAQAQPSNYQISSRPSTNRASTAGGHAAAQNETWTVHLTNVSPQTTKFAHPQT
ncbi:hypothetical protein ASPCADRAFT_207905 [Aspergillus carbonarius ITEM 5010]|uniref:Uncharacterized protein n=1 Tax=Aspergillus carbonarius (strain ITEM 5010) TaxID=602072 RepID=A0A1R3RLR6_ASPC5|nr:hypothetical protein ASPCADRAFT_207905 [Aspergillus carbonarius ITEM 5010]